MKNTIFYNANITRCDNSSIRIDFSARKYELEFGAIGIIGLDYRIVKRMYCSLNVLYDISTSFHNTGIRYDLTHIYTYGAFMGIRYNIIE